MKRGASRADDHSVKPRLLRISLAVVAGLLACGLPLWPIPYRDVSMPVNPSPVTWLFLGSLAGVFAGWIVRPSFKTPVLSVAAGFALAVMIRVAVETASDPTSHNLWPLEVMIATFFGVLAGLVGVSLARGAQRLLGT
jgi:hypothetical protein